MSTTSQVSTIDPAAFYERVRERGVDLFVGVPDSLLTDLCACVFQLAPRNSNVITVNEGAAVGMAVGYYVATGRSAAVYMQNSGLGNVVNPVTSLAHPEVYSVPMLLVVGWRGEPGVKDEPQHVAQGRLTPAMLEALEIPFVVLDPDAWQEQVDEITALMESERRPVALVVRKGVFSKYPFSPEVVRPGVTLTREEALGAILDAVDPDCFIVSTTGKTSRELFELREARGQEHDHDFLTVGGMGHTSSIATGMSLGTDRLVYCIDGDGSFLMHMGAVATAAQRGGDNLRYILVNNGAHESVGGQPTIAFDVDVSAVLEGVGFEQVETVSALEDVEPACRRLTQSRRSALVIETAQGSRVDLGRPTVAPSENKEAMRRAFDDAAGLGG